MTVGYKRLLRSVTKRIDNMTILLSGDDYVYHYQGNFYVRAFGKALIERYLSVYDKLFLMWRTKEVGTEGALGQYNIPVDKRVTVIKVPFFQGPVEFAKEYLKIKKTVNKLPIKDISLAIFRLPSNTGFVVCEAIKRLGVPYAIEIVANPYDLVKTSGSIVTKASMYLWHRKLMGAVKHSIGVSCVTKESLQLRYPTQKGQLTASYSSADIPEAFFRGKRDYPKQDVYTICHVASVVKNDAKGNKEVIDVALRLKQKGIRVKVVFVGEGSFMEWIASYAEQYNFKESVVFAGVVDHQKLLEILITSDLMLFPSKSEGLPRVIIEAMATGMPCVASNVGGIPELLPANDVFLPTDVEGMTSRVEQLLRKPDVYENESLLMVNNSNEYRKDILQAKRIAFYQSLAASVNV